MTKTARQESPSSPATDNWSIAAVDRAKGHTRCRYRVRDLPRKGAADDCETTGHDNAAPNPWALAGEISARIPDRDRTTPSRGEDGPRRYANASSPVSIT